LGSAFVYGDNVDTDVIIPARYLTTTDEKELAAHALEDLDPTFVERVRPGDVVVAGDNFGCGSSREHAPVALKGTGVQAVVARSFARIFFRNAINTGLAIVVCPAAVDARFAADPLPDFVMDIVRAGGLVPWVRARVGAA
jgi:3-isopropylmalate/(R)-2-methylmalate dehydratase small subunit